MTHAVTQSSPSPRATTLGDSKNARAWLLVAAGARKGERFPLDGSSVTIGRAEGVDIRLTDPGVTDVHARVYLDQDQWVVEDVEGKHETFVNDLRVREYAIRDGDRIRLGRSILKLVSGPDSETRCENELFQTSTQDALTLVGSRASFEQALARETGRARRHAKPLALLVLDVDGFTALNDARGDAVGSAVLQMLCARLRPHLRLQDLVARIGDDEFAILLPETSQASMRDVGEKLCALASAEPFNVDGDEVRVTVSGGVASFDPVESDEAFARRARAAVDAACAAGGDRLHLG